MCMSNIIAFMKKDIRFNFKWLLVCIVSSIAIPVYLVNGELKLFTGSSMIFSISSLTSVMFCISRACYIEDNDETKTLLKSIPMSGSQQIGAKFLLTIMLIVVSNSLSYICLIICGYENLADAYFISLSLTLLYFAIFLFTFFIFGYQIAQYTFIICILVVVILKRIGFENLNMSVDYWIIFIMTTIIYCSTYIITTKVSEKIRR